MKKYLVVVLFVACNSFIISAVTRNDSSEKSLDCKAVEQKLVISHELGVAPQEVHNLVDEQSKCCAIRAMVAFEIAHRLQEGFDKDCMNLVAETYRLGVFSTKETRSILFSNFENKHSECAKLAWHFIVSQGK